MHTNSVDKAFHVIMHRHRTSGRSNHSAVRLHGCGTLRNAQGLSETPFAVTTASVRNASYGMVPSRFSFPVLTADDIERGPMMCDFNCFPFDFAHLCAILSFFPSKQHTRGLSSGLDGRSYIENAERGGFGYKTSFRSTIHNHPQPPRPPQEPHQSQPPKGWMLSFDSRLPIPQLSVKNQKRAPQKGSPVKPVKASVKLVSVVGIEPFDTINLSNEVWS